MDIVSQHLPLAVEKELYIGEKLHILRKESAVLFNGFSLMEANILILPLRPACHTEMALAGHKKGIVGKPASVFFHKCGNSLRISLPSSFLGKSKDRETVFVNLAVVHLAGIIAPVNTLDLFLFKECILNQHIKVNEIGIARIGRKALIRGVSHTCGSQWQHLPPALTRLRKKVRKVIGRFAQGAYSAGGRQR